VSHLDELTRSLVAVYSKGLNADEQEELIEALEVLADEQKYNKAANYYPDEGLLRRELYPKQINFFAAGADFTERAFIAANQIGKSEAGAYEARCHATGKYPHWWKGKRFNHPTIGWVGGDTATTVRDIIQVKLVGPDINDMGSGMLSREDIIVEDCKTRRNVPEALEIIKVRHITGGVSTIVLKTYEQGRKTWQGTVIDWIWVDEECPEDVYGEALIRLVNSGGLIFTTFTPLQGVTPLVLSFLDNSQDTDVEHPKYVGVCTWDDVPHISEETKKKILASTPPQLRDARTRGVPTVGAGMVYPVDPENLVVDDFVVPHHYKRLYALDVGWNMTAALWGAWDIDNDIIYLISEHRQGMAEPIIHAKAIKARGKQKGVIDPAARGRSQKDGERLYDIYTKPEPEGCGLNLFLANNAVESGIFDVYERMTTGRLKIFRSLSNLQRELSLYHRDESGQIVKKNDHLMDDMRYLVNAPAYLWDYLVNPLQKRQVVDFKSKMRGCV
jgi:phage terminase large subunit-like protein